MGSRPFAVLVLLHTFGVVIAVQGQTPDPHGFRSPFNAEQQYDRQWGFRLPSGSLHTGRDIYSNADAQVRAAADGVVIRIHRQTPCSDCNTRCPDGACAYGPDRSCEDHGMGNVIFLKHLLTDGRVVFTSYNHLGSIATGLAEGQCIQKGAVLGIYGASGNGCPNHWEQAHLHYEVKRQPTLGNACAAMGLRIDQKWAYMPGDPTAFGYFDPLGYQTTQQARSCAALLTDRCSGPDRYPGLPHEAVPSRVAPVTVAIQSNDPLRGECINTPNDTDYLTFYGKAGQSVTLEVQPVDSPPSGSSDCGIAQLALQKVDGTPETSSKTTVSAGTRITHTLSGTGRYLVKIRREGPTVGEYVFTKNVGDPVVGNKTNPTNVSLASPVFDFINYPNDADWYAFTVASTTPTDIEVLKRNSLMYAEASAQLKLQIAVYASPSDEGIRPAVFSPGTKNEDLSFDDARYRVQLAPGTYYLKVRAYQNQTGYYSVRVTSTSVTTP